MKQKNNARRPRPTWNPETDEAKYPYSIHSSELQRSESKTGSSCVEEDEDIPEVSNLAAGYGINLALQSLRR